MPLADTFAKKYAILCHPDRVWMAGPPNYRMLMFIAKDETYTVVNMVREGWLEPNEDWTSFTSTRWGELIRKQMQRARWGWFHEEMETAQPATLQVMLPGSCPSSTSSPTAAGTGPGPDRGGKATGSGTGPSGIKASP